MFSGGDFREVARWLQNFLTSHAKLESPRIEASVEADEDHPVAYRVGLRLGRRLSARVELDFKTVADNRGSIEWCRKLAAQVRSWARELLAAAREESRPAGNPGPGSADFSGERRDRLDPARPDVLNTAGNL